MELTNPKLEVNEPDEEFVINVGPQHPSTHGVLHLEIKLDGEQVLDVKPNLGYIHRGIEKISESLSYKQFTYLTSRMDYLSAHINNQGCALVVEKGLEMEIPERAKVIRILMAELTRIASHQLWWGALGLDLGAVSPFFFAFREREEILEVFEETCGYRLTMNYITPGGVMQDLHPEFVPKVKKIMAELKNTMKEYDRLLTGNIIFQKRTQGVGILTKEDLVSLGITGPIARASGLSCDVRKHSPYEGYEKLDFKEILATTGDSYTRYLVRLEEMKQSIYIVEQLIDNIPEGPFREKTKAVIKLPKGEFYQKVETARGELGIYLVSDGGSKPYRLKYRTPNFSNLQALKPMVIGSKIGDLVAIMATLDLIIPDIDR